MCFVSLLILNSCQNSDDDAITSIEETVDLKLIEIIESGTEPDEKSNFIVLSNNGKALVWQRKLNKLLTSNSFNKEQLQMIEEAIELISPEIYDDESRGNLEKYKKLETWITRAKVTFSKDLAFESFFVINSRVVSPGPDFIEGDDEDCECNKRDDWCFGPGADCEGASCEADNDGCGFFNIRACNGLCGVAGDGENDN